jgi:hypothetical protein
MLKDSDFDFFNVAKNVATTRIYAVLPSVKQNAKMQ